MSVSLHVSNLQKQLDNPAVDSELSQVRKEIVHINKMKKDMWNGKVSPATVGCIAITDAFLVLQPRIDTLCERRDLIKSQLQNRIAINKEVYDSTKLHELPITEIAAFAC